MKFVEFDLFFKYLIRKVIRRACQAGVLGFRYPPEFSIKTCLQWRMYRHERATINYLKTLLKPGDVFVDVGAHIGYYATYVGKLVGYHGTVYAFEPHPDNYILLVKNCKNLPQAKTIQSAVSDSIGEAELFIHSTSSSSHALVDISRSGKSCIVPKVSLDEWASKNKVNKINVVLIDVEGHELAVLLGMRNIIEKNPNITIIIEYCPSNWASSNENINKWIDEIYKMQLSITCALGQNRKYDFSESTSAQITSQNLFEILNVEIKQEHKDYVNIAVSRYE